MAICFFFWLKNMVFADCDGCFGKGVESNYTIMDLIRSSDALRALDETDKPDHVKECLRDFRSKLNSYVCQELNENLAHSVSLKEIQTKIEKEFKDSKLDDGDLIEEKIKSTGDDTAFVYGANVGIDLTECGSSKKLIGLRTFINVKCGDEIDFVLFERVKGVWKPILFDSDEDHVCSSLKFLLLNNEGNEFGYSVVSRLTTWCTSTWQTSILTVYRRGDPLGRKIYSYEIPTCLDTDNSDDAMILTKVANGFSLKVDNDEGGKVPALAFKHEYVFSLMNGMVREVKIKAEEPRE